LACPVRGGVVEPGWRTHCVFGGPLHWIGKRFP